MSPNLAALRTISRRPFLTAVLRSKSCTDRTRDFCVCTEISPVGLNMIIDGSASVVNIGSDLAKQPEPVPLDY